MAFGLPGGQDHELAEAHADLFGEAVEGVEGAVADEVVCEFVGLVFRGRCFVWFCCRTATLFIS